ncbi:MAG: hypothetical protein ACOVNU_01665 [Candidatus Kapaibacteriota bacterium]|jgi:hypothetical protein
MNFKKLTKKEKIQLQNENKVIEKDNEDDYLKNGGILVGLICFIPLFFMSMYAINLDKSDSFYLKAQGTLFMFGFVAVFYNIVFSIFSFNMLKEYSVILKSMVSGKLDFRDSYNQLVLANISNLTIAIIVLTFIVDWSLWGGFKVQITTTLSIFFIFTIIEVIKAIIKSKSKK